MSPSEMIMVAIDAIEDRPPRYDDAKRILADVPKCIIRTHDAGVHFGKLAFVANATHGAYRVVLVEARRIWDWQGANTLSSMALRGIKTGKVDEEIESISIPQVIEIIPCMPAAVKNLEKQKWA